MATSSSSSSCSGSQPFTLRTYEEAITKLNECQSNAAALERQRLNGGRDLVKDMAEFAATVKSLGFSEERLDSLNVIHVAGSKGKGSVCAFTESILRKKGFKTGFYSSPHLIEARERIRINGAPVSREAFAKAFWVVWDQLVEAPPLPTYFRFLTLVAFQIFLEEGVDVAILEVGMGGRFDATNVIRHPVVCGVSSLALEHVAILGNTLTMIAHAKGGIFKEGVPAFTMAQKEEAMIELFSLAKEKEIRLYEVPLLSSYPGHDLVQLGIHGSHQLMNASLALQLSRTWLKRKKGQFRDVSDNTPYALSQSDIDGLNTCFWPGRAQKVSRDGVSYFLDGAHTAESASFCAEWFSSEIQKDKSGHVPSRNVLLFNCGGDRSPAVLLPPFLSLGFSEALFCPNIASHSHPTADQQNNTVSQSAHEKGPMANRHAWETLNRDTGKEARSLLFKDVEDAIAHVNATSSAHPGVRLNVLVVGSLHLVGAVLNVLGEEVR